MSNADDPELQARIKALSPDKQALLLQKLQTKTAEEARPPIPRRPHQTKSPLSFAQQRLFFLDRFEGVGTEYNLPEAWRLRGPLDIEALKRALSLMVERHESLRTRFVEEDSGPVQLIDAEGQIPVSVEDLRGLSPEETRSAISDACERDLREPFNLATGPLMRVRLLVLGDQDHLLLRNTHHIIFDAWSQGVFLKELSALYAACKEGKPSPLPPLATQYADYAVWQRGWLQGNELVRQIGYWRTQIGSPVTLELPTDRPRPVIQTFAGARYPFVLSPESTAKLKEFNKRENVTPFMSLLAAFNVLLARYSGQRDIRVGAPITNRQRVQLEGLIGFFVNTLVLRADLSGQPSFRDVAKRVRRASLDAFQHQDIPFEKLVEELNPPRDLSRHPFFQVMFTVLGEAPPVLELTGLEIAQHVLPTHSIRFDLELRLRPDGPNWAGAIYYNSSLFDEPTIARLMGHYQTLLEGMLENPEQPVWTVPMLTPPERRQILVEWNNTATDYPREACVHELFEEQAQKSPEAVAVVFGEERLTYGELSRRSNVLAARLIESGARPDFLAGICAERSVEMIVGILATLKAGGAYVPIDPAQPAERVSFLLVEAAIEVLLVQKRFINGLPPHRAKLVSLESDGLAPSPISPAQKPGPENLAYVLFTSGSTGRPKGVCVPHRGITRLVKNTNFARFGPEEIFLQLAPLSFDASTLEIWGALLNGGTLVVHPPRQPSLAELGEFIKLSKITTLWLTAGLFHQMVEEQLESLQGVRQLLAGGDVLSPAHLRKALQGLPGRRVVNGYGPTENTTFTCCHHITPADVEGARVPIGRPVANTTVYLLDEHLQPVPVGVPGELHAGGDGLARGYLNSPELTEAKFIPNPFSPQPGARLYKTGDLCRYEPDGTIEFLGRADNQVKIRGFRVELGEIEAALQNHKAVGKAVVILREPSPGDKRLTAYLVASSSEALPSESELRSFLKKWLPDHMVPAEFVTLEKLPLTTNGKVDRKALPAPDYIPRPASTRFAAPRTPIEEALAGIWAEVLRLGRVGIHDNFFEIGGHSLLATQVVARIRRILLTEVPLRVLFEHPTVAGLAGQITELQGAAASVAPPLIHAEHGQNPPLSFAQQRLWFLDRYEESSAEYNVPCAWLLRGNLNQKALEQAVNVVVARHDSLRARFVETDGGAMQIVEPETLVPLRLEDVGSLEAGRRDEAVREAWQRELREPFDLAKGPLLRAGLIVLAEKERLLLLTFHHIAFDGWSLNVFNRELAASYAALLHEQKPSLPNLPVQYADYAVWQRAWLQDRELDRQLAYWKGQLASAPALDLPSDRPRPARQTSAGARHFFLLPVELATRLAAFNRSANVTPFMSLLGTFQVLLARYSGQRDILVGTPIANRQRQELEDLIGFFVNTLVMRVDLSGEPCFRDVVAKVRQTALEAYQHQDLPFEKLVEEIKPVRDLSRHPLFQVMFGLQNTPSSPFQLEGLDVSQPALPAASTHFDLELHLQARGNTWAGVIYHNTALFDEATILRLAGHYETLLDSMLAEPARPVWNAAILTPSERYQTLVEWNKTAVDYPLDKCLHQWIEEQAARTPDAVAVAFEKVSLTYRQLNEKANQLARHLQGLGVGVESLVGICVERSLEMVVGLLAILKAGGAYVPLDPDYPKDRLAFMLEDADARVLLTQDRLARTLPPSAATLVKLDTDWPLIAAGSSAPLETVVGPENAAYMIYTSGSTGRPKGAVNTHRGIVNRLLWMQDEYHLTGADTVLQKTPFSFDVSVWEFFWPLMTGARLVVARPGGHRDTAYLSRLIAAEGITTLHFVPSMLQIFLSQENPAASCASLKRVICSGEALPAELERKFYSSMAAELHNLYGPTEASVDVTFWPCPRDDQSSTVPIGRPIANTQIYILDDHLQPVPAGVAGELHIGGVGLARGYHRRPDLTREKFIPDPFHPEGGARLYKTGDLARHRKDGVIEYLSRMDHQVKIRGFRIELGEIESAIAQHTAVREVVVMAREDSPGDRRLAAYFVAAESTTAPTTAELREFLSQRLPDYMVPAAFVPREKLPLTPNGKVDRKALPAPDYQAAAGPRFTAPRTPIEEALVGIWIEVLGLGRVGVDDNFFEIGGHSLLATQVVARIRRALDIVVPLRVLFEHPTVAGLAAQIAALDEIPENTDSEMMEQLLAELENLGDEDAKSPKPEIE